jgi:hypothetical protein
MLAVSSCAIACAPRFVSPSRGGPSWRELRSAHFVLRTDLPEGEARLRMADLETYRDAMLAAWPARPPSREVAVFAPATAEEMDEFSNDREQRELGFTYTDWFGASTVVIRGDHPWASEPSLAACLGNQMMDANLRRAPFWLEVGLAAWLRMIRVDGGRPILGSPDPRYAGDLPKLGPAPPEWVKAWTPRSSNTRLLPHTSWLLVQMLNVTRQDAFRAFLRRLSEGEAPSSAWTGSFSGVSDELLDAELKKQAAAGTVQVESLARLATGVPAIEARNLTESEIHAYRAEVRAYSPVRFGVAQVTDEGNAAFELDPTNARAIVFASVNAKEHEERARHATAARPDDWRAQMVLWAARFQLLAGQSPHVALPLWYLAAYYWLHPVSDSQLDAAAERAAELAPENTTVLGIVAGSRLIRRQYVGALSAAEAVLRVAPGAVGPLMLYADALAGTDRCDEAGRAARLAAARLDEIERPQGPIFYGHVFSTGQADLGDALRERASRYSARCTPVAR